MTDNHNKQIMNVDNLQVPSSQVVVFYTEWNQHITEALLAGAKLVLADFPHIKVEAYQVPGAVELTHAVAMHHRYRPADAYIVFGCVIRGETPHFDYVCQSVTQGISQLNVHLDAATIFGVLTVNHEEEAIARIGGAHGHKGQEAAVAALKMLQLKHQFSK